MVWAKTAKREEHRLRLDGLVNEAVETLARTHASKTGTRLPNQINRKIIKAPWMVYPEKLKTLLESDDPEMKAAIVYEANVFPEFFLNKLSMHDGHRFRLHESNVARIGEALYRAKQLKELGGEEFGKAASEQMDNVWAAVYWMGYRSIGIWSIAKQAIGEQAKYTRTEALEERLTAKAITLPGVQTFYTKYGFQVFFEEDKEQHVIGELSRYVDSVVPERLRLNGFAPFETYLAIRVEDDGLEGDKILDEMLVDEFIKNAMAASSLTVAIDTIDGVVNYIPPELAEKAREVVNQVLAERVARYIEAGGSRPLSALVTEGLADTEHTEQKHRKNRKRQAKIENSVRSSPQLAAYVKEKETMEGPIVYVAKEGVLEVQRFIAETITSAAASHSLTGRIRMPQMPGLSLRLPSFSFKKPEQNAQEETAHASRVQPPVEVDTYNRRTGRTASQAASSRTYNPELLQGLWQVREMYKQALHPPSNRRTKGKVWNDFHNATRAYVAFLQSLQEEPEAAARLGGKVREDIELGKGLVKQLQRRGLSGDYVRRFEARLAELKQYTPQQK
ncbi:MAG: hypothetical protein AABX60_01910 [Nanoarchaeota archaeon]